MNEGNFNRASRKYLTNIGYLTKSRPQLFLNGKQLQGIAIQQRSERKHKGDNGAADLEYDAAILEYNTAMLEDYMPSPPKSKPVTSRRGGRKHTRNKKRRSKTNKKRKNKRKTKRNKRNTKKNNKIIGSGTCSSSEAKCIDNIPTAKAQGLNSATRTSFKHGLIPLAKAETPRVAAYNVPVYKQDKTN